MMAFYSKYATLLWDKLYRVSIPDQLTLTSSYLKTRGVYISGRRETDSTAMTQFTSVMIPVIKILEYYEDGIEVRIESRDDMLQMYKDITAYLQEWRNHIRNDINLDVEENVKLLKALDSLSSYIHDKAKPRELINTNTVRSKFGLMSPLDQLEEKNKTVEKSNYEGISKLIRSKTNKSRF